jgi:hypothetical protein
MRGFSPHGLPESGGQYRLSTPAGEIREPNGNAFVFEDEVETLSCKVTAWHYQG